MKKSNQTALQADGVTPLEILGETHLIVSRDGQELHSEALVVCDLDVDLLAGIPFMDFNTCGFTILKNDLEKQGVFQKPEDVGVTVEYLNLSFLVKKPVPFDQLSDR